MPFESLFESSLKRTQLQLTLSQCEALLTGRSYQEAPGQDVLGR